MKMLCSVKLSPHKYETPEGYLVCKDCIIARTGKQTYLRSELFENVSDAEDAYIDVDRNEKEVFSEKTMASFEGKPLTIEHPSESVSPENWKQLSVGNIYNVHRGQFEGQDVMYADINVYDAEAIDLIKSGEMIELSCGYDCDITEGDNPEQINIRGNHIALCEQGRAGVARIQDSWGAKPVIKDSVQKGTLIQEFGRYGEQYKVVKIEGNVLYCEELVTKKNTLFKKDKENIDWAIITKAQVHDSQDKKVSWEEAVKNSYNHFVSDLGKKPSASEVLEDVVKNYNLDVDVKIELDDPNKYNKWVSEVQQILNKEKLEFIEDFQEDKQGRYVNGKLIPDRHEAWELAKRLYKEGKLQEFSEYWIDEMGYGHETDLRGTLKRAIGDSVSEDRNLLYSKEPHYTIELEEDTLYHSIDGTRRSSGYHETEYDKKIWDNFEEAKKAAQELFDKYKEKKEIKEGSYSYYSVKIVEWIEGGGNYINMDGKENGPFPALTAFDPKEVPESLKKDLGIKDQVEEKYAPNRYSDEFTQEEIDEFLRVENEKQDPTGNRRKKVFVNKDEKEKFYKEMEAVEEAEVRADEFDTDPYHDGRYLVYWEVYYWDIPVKDSFAHLFVISLPDNNFLDEEDKPTNDIKKAKRFTSYEEADSHRKCNCNGVVQEIHDSFDAKDPKEVEEIKKLLEGIEYDKIAESWNSLTIDFSDKSEMKKAGKKLTKLYDIELFDDDEDELYIAIYDKFDKPFEGNDFIEDSDKWFGYNLRKGNPAEDFKQYLRDRGMYFEPSENGEFIHFEVKNADEDVEKEIRAINKHYQEVGLFDSYSKKFYVNALKALNEKLEKLRKDELLDQNQQDYEIQKSKMMKEIEKQISEYTKKLDELK